MSLLRNEVAHLKQLLLAHKDCPVTTLQKKTAYLAAEESMKDNSEPTGSPAPVIQHSSLAPSLSSGQNGLSSRAAAEAMAMSVLAGMGQQQRSESGPSHIIMAAQSQSAARWWEMPPRPRNDSLSSSRGTKEQRIFNLVPPEFFNLEVKITSPSTPLRSSALSAPSCWAILAVAWSLAAAFWEWTETF